MTIFIHYLEDSNIHFLSKYRHCPFQSLSGCQHTASDLWRFRISTALDATEIRSFSGLIFRLLFPTSSSDYLFMAWRTCKTAFKSPKIDKINVRPVRINLKPFDFQDELTSSFQHFPSSSSSTSFKTYNVDNCSTFIIENRRDPRMQTKRR